MQVGALAYAGALLFLEEDGGESTNLYLPLSLREKGSFL